MWCTDSKKKRHIIHTASTVNGQYTQNQTESSASENKTVKERGQTECWQCCTFNAGTAILSGSKSEFADSMNQEFVLLSVVVRNALTGIYRVLYGSWMLGLLWETS